MKPQIFIDVLNANDNPSTGSGQAKLTNRGQDKLQQSELIKISRHKARCCTSNVLPAAKLEIFKMMLLYLITKT